MTDIINFSMVRGDSRTFLFQSTEVGGGPTDLTTYQQIWFTVKRVTSDPDSAAVFQKTLGGGGIVVVAGNHAQAMVIINPTDTAGVTIAGSNITLLYDLQTKDSAGNINTAHTGTFTLTPDVTLAA